MQKRCVSQRQEVNLKKRIRRFTKFSKKIGKGLHIEMKETIDIPKHIKNREYKKAGAQVVDIFKMAGLTVVWVIPGGAVITAMIVKFSHKARPSAFHPDSIEDESSRSKDINKDL